MSVVKETFSISNLKFIGYLLKNSYINSNNNTNDAIKLIQAIISLVGATGAVYNSPLKNFIKRFAKLKPGTKL